MDGIGVLVDLVECVSDFELYVFFFFFKHSFDFEIFFLYFLFCLIFWDLTFYVYILFVVPMLYFYYRIPLPKWREIYGRTKISRPYD